MLISIEALSAWANLMISFVALIVAVIALGYTVEAYLLKKGHNIRCSFGAGWTVESNDHYIHNLMLENLKDRASVILKIYLKIGSNIFLELDDFEDKPLILRPFEVYSKRYDPVLFYSDGYSPVELNSLISNDKHKKNIILFTTDGKYTAKLNTAMSDINSDYFDNYATLIVTPSRLEYGGKSYGSNIKYLIVLKNTEGKEEVVEVNKEFRFVPKFNKFKLTEEACETKETLKAFLLSQKEAGNLSYDSIDVIGFAEHVEKRKKLYKGKPIVAEPEGLFEYYVSGKIFTLKHKLELKLKNYKSRQKSKKLQNKK